MSSQPDPAAPSAASPESSHASSQPAAGVTTEHAASGAVSGSSCASNPAPAEAPRKPIRIGSQRYGVKPPAAVPKPVIGPAAKPPQPAPAQPAAAEAVASIPAEAPVPAAEEPASPVVAEAPAPPAEAATQAPAQQPAPRGEKLAPRPQKLTGPKPSKVAGLVDPRPSRTVAPPSIRGGLSEDLEMEYLEALGGQSLDEIIAGESTQAVAELEPESRHRGKVISIHRDDVFIEIGGRQQGILSLRNFAEPPEPGVQLDVIVSRFNPTEGFYELMVPGGAVDVGDWSEVAEGMVVEARVTGHNKGGLECEVNKLRGFIPASQISMYRVEDLAQFVDQKLLCVITEANPEKRNLVLSHRAVLERDKAEAKTKLMAELEVGQVREGTVRSLQNFGAFVDLGGVDGLIHISQLSWDRIKHAEEVLQLGQKVKVKIQKIDPQTGKIGLAFRDLAENPWENAARDFPARSTVKGTVSRLMEFGAFVRLAPGVEGLIHISELSHKRVFRVSDVLKEGQEVDVLVLSVDPEQQRISLSLKALEAKAAPAAVEPEPEEPEAPPEPPKKRKTPLKGGIGGPPSGEKFGLKW